jgi:hypothetical protein
MDKVEDLERGARVPVLLGIGYILEQADGSAKGRSQVLGDKLVRLDYAARVVKDRNQVRLLVEVCLATQLAYTLG